MTEIYAEDLVKRFGKTVALDHATFRVTEGKILCILAPSGSGKSTILRLIAGLWSPDQGNIYFDDKIVNSVPPSERGVGMVFQNYSLYPHMTIRDNVAFPLAIKGISKAKIHDAVQGVADMLRISQILGKKPNEVSGGEAQRAAIARALIKEPNILLFDEPLSNVDAVLRVYLRTEIKRIQQKLKTTTVYVTHDQVEAMTIADELLIMNKGQVMQAGSSEEIFEKPGNTFVAGFIGNPPMNLLEGIVDFADGSYVFRNDFMTLTLPESISKAENTSRVVGKQVSLGIRAEDMEICDEGCDTRGSLTALEPQGTSCICYIRLSDDSVVRAMAHGFGKFSVGQALGIKMHAERAHVYNEEGNLIA